MENPGTHKWPLTYPPGKPLLPVFRRGHPISRGFPNTAWEFAQIGAETFLVFYTMLFPQN